MGGRLKFPRKLAGYFNHLWFVEVINNELVFTIKTPLIHVLKEFQIKRVPSPIVEFFWENKFKYQEKLVLSLKDAIHDLLGFKLKEINSERGRRKLKRKAEKFLSLTLSQRIKFKLKKLLGK